MHGVVHRQYLHRALGALGQDIIKIINQSTHFINELPYTNFVTVAPLALVTTAASFALLHIVSCCHLASQESEMRT